MKETNEIFRIADTANAWSPKIEYILSSPSQRDEYRALDNNQEKVDFFLNHFVMNDLAIRQLSFALAEDQIERQDFINKIDYLIEILESETERVQLF